jgi:hypothetical protein
MKTPIVSYHSCDARYSWRASNHTVSIWWLMRSPEGELPQICKKSGRRMYVNLPSLPKRISFGFVVIKPFAIL